MLRRITIALAAVVLAVIGLGASQASAAEFFGQQVQPGTVVNSVAVQSGLVRLTDVSVTTATDGNVQASANLYAGASTTPVRVNVQYANADNWAINVQRNGAAPGYAPTSSTSLDINDVEGTITKSGGYLTYQLVLRGYVLGDGTFDMTVRVEPEGFVATTVVEDLELGSFTLSHASIEVSSLDAFAEVQASLETTGGNFDVDIKATKPGNATPDQYTLDILFEGAELEGENPAFQFHSFGFRVVLTNPTTGCATIDTSARGSVTIGTSTYTVNDIAIGISCDQLYKFAFSVTLSHYERWSGVTKTANLAIGFMNAPGVYTTKYQGGLFYQRGFFGSVELDAERSFSEKIETDRMKRTVTVRTRKGTRTVQKEVFMHPTTGDIQAAGHFAASRIGRDLTIDITNSKAKGAYPITVVTYTIVRKDKRMAPATRKTLRYFLSDDAQRMLTGLGYAPLPKSLLTRARAQLAAAR